jgi:hypothetical protein
VQSNQAVQPVLASDVERDKTAQLVSHAVGEGRLSIEEGGQRIDAALRARHRRELERLVADLPALAQVPSARPAAARIRFVLLVSAASLVAAAMLLQAIAGMWELWPVAIAALGAAAFRPRH